MSPPAPPTPPTPSSPPTYTPPITPAKIYPQPPAFRHRKSSNADSAAAAASEESTTPTAVSPIPQRGLRSDIVEAMEDDHGLCHPIQTLPPHMRDGIALSRTSSNTSSLSLAEEGEATPLLVLQNDDGYRGKWYKGPLFVAAVKLGILFAIFTVIVVGTFYFGMPKLDEDDQGAVKLPKSFADLQALNALFQKYKHRYPLRILACGVVSYLFVQTFSLPGSMYLSILFGAAYGIMYGLVLSCLCESVGSLFCYTLSSVLAPPLLTLPFYRARVETWRSKIMGDPNSGKIVTWDSIFAILIVLRISPFPPHWIANFVAPHLGIGRFLFWASCFIGIAPVSVIHVTIGSSLDNMTSASDFHLLSLRNILGLSAVIVAVLIPVGLKRIFRKDLGDLGSAEEALHASSNNEREITVPAVGTGSGRMYHAIDSGVVLAVPSRGDGMDMRTKLIQGNGRILEIIPDADEESSETGSSHISSSNFSTLPQTPTTPDIYIPHQNLQGVHHDDDEPGPSRRSSSSTHTMTPSSLEYRLFDANDHFDRVQMVRQTAVKPHRPNRLRGYGAVEQPSLVEATSDRERAVGHGWFGGWARGGVA